MLRKENFKESLIFLILLLAMFSARGVSFRLCSGGGGGEKEGVTEAQQQIFDGGWNEIAISTATATLSVLSRC